MAKYDRYLKFRGNGKIGFVPFVPVPKGSNDFYEVYKRGKTRLDKVSYDYYGDSNFAWFILQANPEYGSLEFNIPDGAVLRIPFPLHDALIGYDNNMEAYFLNNL